jgi:hypothetical protein
MSGRTYVMLASLIPVNKINFHLSRKTLVNCLPNLKQNSTNAHCKLFGMSSSFSPYPLTSESELKKLYVGKSLGDVEVPTPAAVIDLPIAKRNCDLMLDAVEKLGVGWRAHVKTHKV